MLGASPELGLIRSSRNETGKILCSYTTRPSPSDRSQRKEVTQVLKKGRRDGNVGNYRSASDILKGGRAVAWVAAAAPYPTMHGQVARPGHATDTVRRRR